MYGYWHVPIGRTSQHEAWHERRGFAADETGGQGFTSGYDGPEFTCLVRQVLGEPQMIIMGRATYEEMARHWPFTADPIAERMNAHLKSLRKPQSTGRRHARSEQVTA